MEQPASSARSRHSALSEFQFVILTRTKPSYTVVRNPLHTHTQRLTLPAGSARKQRRSRVNICPPASGRAGNKAIGWTCSHDGPREKGAGSRRCVGSGGGGVLSASPRCWIQKKRRNFRNEPSKRNAENSDFAQPSSSIFTEYQR